VVFIAKDPLQFGSLLFATVILVLVEFAACSTLIVPHEYPTIQQAIDSAIAGDSIEVQSGIYQEQVIINKSLKLSGMDTGGGIPAIISEYVDSIIKINADYVIVEGLQIMNTYDAATNAGIIVNGNNNILRDNVLNSKGYSGFRILNSHNNTILNNTVSNKDYGIYLDNGSLNTITSNNISNNFIGIYIKLSSKNIGDNRIAHNKYGMVYDVPFLIESDIYNNIYHENGYNTARIGEIGLEP